MLHFLAFTARFSPAGRNVPYILYVFFRVVNRSFCGAKIFLRYFFNQKQKNIPQKCKKSFFVLFVAIHRFFKPYFLATFAVLHKEIQQQISRQYPSAVEKGKKFLTLLHVCGQQKREKHREAENGIQ